MKRFAWTGTFTAVNVPRASQERPPGALMARLDEKVAHLINPRGSKQRDFKLPGGITATGLRAGEVGKTDLTRFAVI